MDSNDLKFLQFSWDKTTQCHTVRLELLKNSSTLKPTTELRFNYKQYKKFIFFEFERLFFSEIAIFESATT